MAHLSMGSSDLRSTAVPTLSTVEDIKTFIRDNDLRTVDDFVTKLPREIRERNTLVYNSHSIQGASYEAPRVLMHSPDGKLTVAYTGRNNARGNHIEVLEFREAQMPPACSFEKSN